MTIFAAAHPLLAEALAERGFTAMTEVQSAVLADNCREQDHWYRRKQVQVKQLPLV